MLGIMQMQGYVWAQTPAGELFVVLVQGGKGYVPGVEHAIEMSDFTFLEPVKWPLHVTAQRQSSVAPSCGEPAAGATPVSAIPRLSGNGSPGYLSARLVQGGR